MKCPNLHCLHTLAGTPDSCPSCGLPLPGAVLGERFKLEGVESTTMTSVQFRGREGGSRVNVRVMLPGQGQEQVVMGMRHDIEAVRDLGSGNMPKILHHDFSGALPWLASDSTAWERAERYIETRGRPLGEKELLRFLEESAKTVGPLHERGLAHRGIRPDAVYYKDSSGQVALGLPAWDTDLEGRAPDLFRSPFEAPEYLPGRATARTDMYALGVTALRLVTGLRGPSLAAAAKNPQAHKDRFGLTQGTFDILCGLLAQDTAKRTSSGGQLLVLLGKIDSTQGGGPSPGGGGGSGPLKAAALAAAGGAAVEGLAEDARRKAGLDEAAERHAARLQEEAKLGKREDLKKKSGLAALLALLIAVPAFLRKIAERAAASPSFQIKLLVAAGLGAAAVTGGGVYVSRQMAADSLRTKPIPHALPTPVIGHDDRAVPTAVDPGLWAKFQAFLPKGIVGGSAPGPSAQPGGKPGGQPAGRPGGSPEGQPAGQPGGQPAGSPGGQGVSPAGGESGGRPGNQPGQPPRPDSRPAPRKGGTDTPYDPVAEPGTDPEDASGLTKQSRFFIRVNKTYKTLTLYRDGQYVTQYVVAIGTGANTPDGRYTVKKKIANPSYDNVPGGDARNPLGTRWLGMDVRYPGGRSIGIHGTNNEESIGQAASGGCIRMKNTEAEQLYDLIPEGTPVEIN